MVTQFHTDIADDYLYFDDVAEVSFQPTSGATVTGIKAIKQSLPIKAVGDNLQFTEAIGVGNTKCIFAMWVSTMQGAEPDQGWISEADGTRWTIAGGQPMSAGTRWRVFATKERN